MGAPGHVRDLRPLRERKINGRLVLLLVLLAGLCSPALALHSTTRLTRHGRRRHHLGILWNPLFRPTHESLLRQNEEVDRLELPRIQDQDELDQLKSSGALLPINESEALHFDPRLAPERRYCRPWTRDFVEDISQAYYREFHAQLQVNSAVRTVKDQKKLRRHNRNAAPESGETASSHLAGITVDLQRRGMSTQQIQWMEQYMVPLQALGLVEPEKSATSGYSTSWCRTAMRDGAKPTYWPSKRLPNLCPSLRLSQPSNRRRFPWLHSSRNYLLTKLLPMLDS